LRKRILFFWWGDFTQFHCAGIELIDLFGCRLIFNKIGSDSVGLSAFFRLPENNFMVSLGEIAANYTF
jgi:hypothetical protein